MSEKPFANKPEIAPNHAAIQTLILWIACGLLTIVVGVISWTTITTVGMQAEIVGIQTAQIGLQTDMTDFKHNLREGTKDRIYRSEAVSIHREHSDRLSRHESNIEKLRDMINLLSSSKVNETVINTRIDSMLRELENIRTMEMDILNRLNRFEQMWRASDKQTSHAR